jgi:hypothetical protein
MRLVAVLLASFSAVLLVATQLYPGGTWFDARSAGFSFWGNFWCDMLDERALNDAPNHAGALCARFAFWLFAAALVRFWPRAARLSPSAAVQRWVAALGIACALLLLAVTLFSSRAEPELHGVCVIASALLGLAAAATLALSMYARADAATRLLSLLLIGSAAVSVFQYVRQGAGADPAEWLAGAQKITSALLLAFMLRCAWLLRAPAPR